MANQIPTEEIKELFKQAGEVFDEADIPQIQAEVPNQESFPTLLFMMAVAKDLIDTPTIITDLAGATGVGLILTGFGRIFATAFSIITAVVLFIWMFGKVGWGATRLIRWAWKRWAVAFLAELLLPFIPATSIFVILVHNRHTKTVRLMLAVLEKIKKSEKGKGGQSRPTLSISSFFPKRTNSAPHTSHTPRPSGERGASNFSQKTPTEPSSSPQLSGEQGTKVEPPVIAPRPAPKPEADIGAQPVFRQTPQNTDGGMQPQQKRKKLGALKGEEYQEEFMRRQNEYLERNNKGSDRVPQNSAPTPQNTEEPKNTRNNNAQGEASPPTQTTGPQVTSPTEPTHREPSSEKEGAAQDTAPRQEGAASTGRSAPSEEEPPIQTSGEETTKSPSGQETTEKKEESLGSEEAEDSSTSTEGKASTEPTGNEVGKTGKTEAEPQATPGTNQGEKQQSQKNSSETSSSTAEGQATETNEQSAQRETQSKETEVGRASSHIKEAAKEKYGGVRGSNNNAGSENRGPNAFNSPTRTDSFRSSFSTGGGASTLRDNSSVGNARREGKRNTLDIEEINRKNRSRIKKQVEEVVHKIQEGEEIKNTGPTPPRETPKTDETSLSE